MDEPLAYLNGKLLPASQATISPIDAGFVTGATVAEQLRSFGGKLFRVAEHLRRLWHSLEVVGVDPGVTPEQLTEVAQKLVEANRRLLHEDDDLGLSIFVTPGIYPAYADALETSSGQSGPTVCLHTYPLPFRLWAAKYRSGQSLVTTDVQQVPPESWPPEVKCRSRMHYYLADRKAAAIEPGARALMLDRNGLVTEASTANVIVYTAKDGLVSPPAAKVLPGISLATALDLARSLEIPTSERELTPADLATADEVLLTSTPLCLLPVTRFNGRRIGSGSPGPTFQRLLSAWSERVGLDLAAQAIRFSGR